MKIKEIFKFAIEQFVHNYFRQICIGCLLIVSMIALGAMFLADYKLNRLRYDLDDILASGIEDKGFIHSYELQTEENINSIKELECIEYIVGYYTGGTDYDWCPEIINIQRQNKDEFTNETYYFYMNDNDGEEGYWPVTCITKGMMEIVELEFQAGGIVREEDREQGVFYVYLGSDYKDIEVGSRFYVEDWDGYIVVAGIIKEGEEFLHENILNLLNENSVASYNTDCMVFLETIANVEDKMLFKVKDGYTIEYAIEEINKLYDDSGLHNRIYSLEDELVKNEKNYHKLNMVNRELLFVLLLTVVVVQTCVCISNFISKKRDYGILYSNGINNKDMINILIVQNIILFSLCAVISIAIGSFFLENINLLEMKYIKHVLLKVGAVVFTMLVVSIIIPSIYISKHKTVDLIYR